MPVLNWFQEWCSSLYLPFFVLIQSNNPSTKLRTGAGKKLGFIKSIPTAKNI